MDPLDLKRSIVLAAILGFVIVSFTVPFHQTIKGPCFTRAGAVWSLSRNGAGQITTGWERNYFNPGAPRLLIQVERPDFVEVVFMPELYDGAHVVAGDTIAYIISREGIGRQSILDAKLDLSQAEYAAMSSGARDEDIAIAEAELRRALAELAAYAPELQRVKSLYEAGLIADSLWLNTQGRYAVLEAEVDMAEATVSAVKAGAKPEELEVARQEISLSERNLESSQKLLGEKEIIIAPLGGEVRFRGDPEELIRIEMMDTLAVFGHIPEATASLLEPGQEMDIHLRADQVPGRTCTLFRYDFGRPDMTGANTIGLLNNIDRTLQSGMTGTVVIPIGKTTLFASLRAKFN